MPTQNEALREAYASCPPSARVYHTPEIWQASFPAPARVVANDMALGIQAGASRDGGVMMRPMSQMGHSRPAQASSKSG